MRSLCKQAKASFFVEKGNSMRLDKYLKVSRLIKRRTVANEACDAGRVMINGKVAKAGTDIKVGDEILPDTVWAERLGIDRALIKYWIRSHDKEYASLRLKGIQENGYTPSDFGFSHRKEIRHMESGRVFASVKDAAKAFGIAPCTISNAMRENRVTGKGRFQWTDVSDK